MFLLRIQPGEQDIRWFIDQPALTTFIDSTRDYLEGLLQDPWKLDFHNLCLRQVYRLVNTLPRLVFMQHGIQYEYNLWWQLDIHLPIDIPSSGVHISLDRYGELAVALEPLSVGPADISRWYRWMHLIRVRGQMVLRLKSFSLWVKI